MTADFLSPAVVAVVYFAIAGRAKRTGLVEVPMGTTLGTIMPVREICDAARKKGVITVVDAFNGMATLDAHPEAVKQVAVADRILVSKADLAAAGDDDAFGFGVHDGVLSPQRVMGTII